MREEEFAKGSVGISESSHSVLVSLVFDPTDPMRDRPFESIVEAFRFAFALGFERNDRKKREGRNVTVAPRQFVVTEYQELLRAELQSSGHSLGQRISEYAEAGCSLMAEAMEYNQDILSLIRNN
jgi:hypothetical protein